ncbi:MAG: hypothetical protein ABH835_03445 [Patescibacteria group bacterium]|nr:hypothetical protein [Patescibacteria group bacterium]
MKQSNFRKILIFLELDTVPKVTSFCAELVPFVGIGYAIVGYNLAGQKLKLVDRGLYIAGEFLASGHILKAIKSSVAQKGFSKAGQHFIKQTGKNAGKIIGNRAINAAQQRALQAFVK